MKYWSKEELLQYIREERLNHLQRVDDHNNAAQSCSVMAKWAEYLDLRCPLCGLELVTSVWVYALGPCIEVDFVCGNRVGYPGTTWTGECSVYHSGELPEKSLRGFATAIREQAQQTVKLLQIQLLSRGDPYDQQNAP